MSEELSNYTGFIRVATIIMINYSDPLRNDNRRFVWLNKHCINYILYVLITQIQLNSTE